jgi:hypothetical protein
MVHTGQWVELQSIYGAMIGVERVWRLTHEEQPFKFIEKKILYARSVLNSSFTRGTSPFRAATSSVSSNLPLHPQSVRAHLNSAVLF